MSRLTGHEPRHWHDTQGGHRMTDPRELHPGARDRDEKLYAEHLARHEDQARNPEPLPGDGPAVLALFEHIESLQAVIAREKLLIIALRQRAAQAPERDHKED